MSKQQLTPRLNRNEPNIVIDGGHEIWPEGTSRSVANNTSLYGSVMFKLNNISSAITLTNSQQASIPSGTNIPFSNQTSKTVSGTLAAGTAINKDYFVEGFDINKILNQSFSVIFWVKSTVAGNRSVSLRNASASHSYVKQYAISAANTWELKVLTFTALSTCPGTLDKANGIGVRVTFGIISGSTFQTSTLNGWTTGNFVSGTAEDTTWLTGTNHDFNIAGMMILPGDWSTLTANTSAYNFLRSGRNYQDELAKTQRYWNSSFEVGTTPANNLGVTDHDIPGAFAPVVTASVNAWGVGYPQIMRTSPTLTFYNPFTATANTFSIAGAGSNAINNYHASSKGFTVRNNATVSAGAINSAYTADARF